MSGHADGPSAAPHPAGHTHTVAPGGDRRYLLAALGLIVVFMLAEVWVGIAAGSLALISDAGHMLTDAASLALAIFAAGLAARPARGRWTYGYQRAEILSAQANGLTLLLLAAWFCYEAVHRLVTPSPVAGAAVLVTAVVGIVVNIAAAWLISRADRRSLNVEGAFQHVLGDLYAFLATAVAGVVVLLTGFARADAIATLVVAGLMIRGGLGLVRESGRIFLEAAPANLDPALIGPAMAAVPGVAEVHDLHIWDVTSDMPALSAHVLVDPTRDCHDVRRDLEVLLRGGYSVDHTTLQVDHEAADGGNGDAPSAQPGPEPHGQRHVSTRVRSPAAAPGPGDGDQDGPARH
jgi:cobalt-zinc-cadmium efflux system protein